MCQVQGEYPDYNNHLSRSRFCLNADQAFNSFTWRAPIRWSGTVGGERVNFIQIDNDASSINYFDWSEFPEILEGAKSYIVEAIDGAMRVMD